MKSLTFQREKLYDEVWPKPMTELAKEYGMNVYQLTKACEELEIQRPKSNESTLLSLIFNDSNYNSTTQILYGYHS